MSDDVIRGISRILKAIAEGLTDDERDRFGLELVDAVRLNKTEEIHKVLSSWLVTVAVRKHPDFKRQTEEFEKLVRSGDLYEGVDLTTLHSS